MKITDQDIEQLTNLIRSNYRKNLKLGIILLVLGAVGLGYGGAFGGGDKGIYFAAGALAVLGGLVLVILSFRDASKHKLIVWLRSCPEEIVWMYEVSGKQNGVRLLKESGDHVFLEVTGPKKADWLNYVHQLIPHAHFGYDQKGQSLVKGKK